MSMRLWVGLALVAGMAVAVCAPMADVSAADEKVPAIKAIMKGTFNKKAGVMPAIAADLKSAEPKWDDDATKAKKMLELAEALGKNTPPKGDKESWEKLTKAYVTEVKAVNEGVAKKDKKATGDAIAKIGKSCKECHDAHQDK